MRKLVLFFLFCLVIVLLRRPPEAQRPGCDYPLPYRIGAVDERFRLGPVTLREIIGDSAAAWEAATGKDLFIYDPAADFTINLVFDERQSETLVRKSTARRLSSAGSSIRDGEANLRSSAETFESERIDFELANAAYEERLAAYNADVTNWNQRGDISRQTRAKLDTDRSRLREMLEELETWRLRLNQDAEYVNRLSEEHSQLVEHYNQGVDTINSLPTTTVEFHSGIYQGDKIEIYQYWNKRDLKLGLTHELGHALGIGHIESPQAVMHFTRSDPAGAGREDTLSPTDIEALENVCSNRATNVGA